MEIRIATVSDIDKIAPVHMNAWRKAYSGIFPNSVLEKLKPDDFSEKWYFWVKNPSKVNFIVQSGDYCPGFISFGIAENTETDASWEIFALYIDPNYWGRGIGKKLMTTCMEFLKEKKIPQIKLWVVKENVKAQVFYEKLGFKKNNKSRKKERFGISFYQDYFIKNL